MHLHRILILDDEKQVRDCVRRQLSERGYETASAANSVEALDVLKSASFDLVVCDLRMPGSSGIEFLRALGQEKIAQRPKVIFCTTENGVAHIRAAIDAGADEYVMKPFDRETLESKFALVGVA